MRREFATTLRCPDCGGPFLVEARSSTALDIREGVLRAPCGRTAPIIDGVPRILPASVDETLMQQHPAFYERHPDLRPPAAGLVRSDSLRTLNAFGDEWKRFPELREAHHRIFRWYFEGPAEVAWAGLRVLDAGCGMGRWLHFAAAEGARIVGMDVSPAIEVAAARDGATAELVQADLRQPPLSPASFDLVYSLGVVHHLEDPLPGIRALAQLVRPGGELRLYVYRTLDGDPIWRRALLAGVTALRKITTRLPYPAVHLVAWLISVVATVLSLWPRRLLRRWRLGDRLTRAWPLAQYADVPFAMLVAEQFDRLVAPLEGRFTRVQVESWIRDIGFELVAVLPGLGWRAIGRRPT